MKYQVRTKTFETNSSSTHSYVINQSCADDIELIFPDEDGYLRLEIVREDYIDGWHLVGFQQKLNYFIHVCVEVEITPWMIENYCEYHLDLIRKNKVRFANIKTAIAEQVGISEDKILFQFPECLGTVDAQDMDEINYSLDNKDLIKEVLFSKKYEIHIADGYESFFDGQY
jgi:hypothetical protein